MARLAGMEGRAQASLILVYALPSDRTEAIGALQAAGLEVKRVFRRLWGISVEGSVAGWRRFLANPEPRPLSVHWNEGQYVDALLEDW